MHRLKRNAPLIFLFGVVLFVFARRFMTSTLGPTNYIATTYLITYDHGFVKRGAAGAFLNFLFGDGFASLALLSALTTAVTFAGSMALAAGLAAAFAFRPTKAQLLLCCAVLASPAAISRFANDIGRADILGFGAAALVFLCAATGRRHAALGLAIAACALLPLIHEAFVLTAFPLIFLILFELERQAHARSATSVGLFAVRSAAPVFVCAAALAIVTLFSHPPDMELDRLAAHFAATSDVPIVLDAIKPIYFGLHENLAWTRQTLSEIEVGANLAATIAFLIGDVIVLGMLAQAVLSQTRDDGPLARASMIGFFLCPLAMTPLFFVAFDHSRWVANMVVISFLSLLFLARLRGYSLMRTIGGWRFALLFAVIHNASAPPVEPVTVDNQYYFLFSKLL